MDLPTRVCRRHGGLALGQLISTGVTSKSCSWMLQTFCALNLAIYSLLQGLEAPDCDAASDDEAPACLTGT